MKWIDRLLLTGCSLVLLATSTIWAWSRFAYPLGRGLSIGIRQCGDFDLVCGIYGDEGDELDEFFHQPTDETWYYESILPPSMLGFGSPAQTLHSHRKRVALGFSVMAYFPNSRDWYLVVGLPFWFGALVGIGGIIYSHRRLKRSRYGGGHCRNCGYDLRASPERCPECGALVRASSRVTDGRGS